MGTKRKSSNNKKRIFLSWSGDRSKVFANALKKILEKRIFGGTNVECFVSNVDISTGSDWWEKIKEELSNCKYGIICITKENIKAPWIYYEAGAIAARGIPTVPLLVSCSLNSLEHTPLSKQQAVEFYNQQSFINMIKNVNEKLGSNISQDHIEIIALSAYNELKVELAPLLKSLKDLRIFNEKYVYPSSITTVTKKTIFLSAPMSSIDEGEYEKLRAFMLELENILKSELKFTDVISPILRVEKQEEFDGKTKAIIDNFTQLKQVECMLVVYPRNLPTSTLVELGYGLALCKRMVIFHKETLPYILEEAGGTIEHVKTFPYHEYSDIRKKIRKNGMALFEKENDE